MLRELIWDYRDKTNVQIQSILFLGTKLAVWIRLIFATLLCQFLFFLSIKKILRLT